MEDILIGFFLFLFALIVAVFNTAVGPTGGALIASISYIIPPPASILLHAITSIFSSGTRSISLFKYIDKQFYRKFLIGSILGILFGKVTFEFINFDFWLVLIGVFLIVTSVSKFVQNILSRIKNIHFLGFFSTALSVYVGTGGKVINPFLLNSENSRKEIVATQSACVATQHLLKIGLLFSLIPLSHEYLFYGIALLIGSQIGNIVGLKVLEKTKDQNYIFLQRIVLFILGIGILIKSAYKYFGISF